MFTLKSLPRAGRAGAVAGALCVGVSSGGLAQSTVTIGMPTSPPNIVHMPVYVASELGFFAEEGLKAEFVIFEGGVKSFRAMVSGDVDVASASGPFSIVGRSRGAKTKLILATSPKLEAVMTAQGDIKTLADLKGRKIGIQQPGGFAWVLSMTVLRSAGLGEKDVQFVSILSEDVPPLVAGQIDTAILHVEQMMVAKSKKPDLHGIANLWEVEPKQLYNAYVVQEKSIADRRKDMVGLAKAIIKGTRAMYTDKAKIMPLLVKHTGLDEKVLSDSYDILVKSCVWDANHGLSQERVAYTTERMEKVGNIEKGKAPSYEESVDLSIAQDALKQVGEWEGTVCPSSV